MQNKYKGRFRLVIYLLVAAAASIYGQEVAPTVGTVLPTPSGGTTGLFRAVVGGQRVVYYELWGAKGDTGVIGYAVPPGEVWKVRGCGISSDDGRMLEWMLQIWVPWKGHKPSQQLLVAVARNVGLTAGTPTLALEKDVILLPGEAIAARVNGMAKDRYMGIRFSAWVFDVEDLPGLVK
jgi:hypothetical protein